MDYFEQSIYLRNKFEIRKETIDLSEANVYIHNYPFLSNKIKDSGSALRFNNNYIESDFETELFWNSKDEDREENNNFRYIILGGNPKVKTKGVIFLFHGLNERFWQKYLPWALTLHKLTGKTIILFPIAFHMNRAPSLWSNPRMMKRISEERINRYKDVVNSTFANAALSTRLHKNPALFFTSGFQTFSDIVELVRTVREGSHNLIYKDATIDFFGYSIGALLAEVLLMANPNREFEKSKLFIFCGGPTFDIMFPIAKAILDSEAYRSTSNFFNLFDDYLCNSKINRDSILEIKYFKSLLSQSGLKDIREKRLIQLKENIFAVSLLKDKVVPPDSVINTLNGIDKNIPIRTMITDFPYEYSHETPFPTDKKQREIININFENIFDLGAAFLG